ncbi:universal stress protein [Arthrobacter gandavensis]|uniref:universal stress protein n=1 Tax=Arthrobacter gandavensis TaxID=169960 RepID=UPI00188ED19B|nr:universal stress protein [Arthrobacter gandavensis]MBF4992578.1 universal stress protein [Arthrobacter gandavensis]
MESAALERILVGVDGSEASVEALQRARQLAEPFGAEIQAVTCWEYPQLYDGYVTIKPEDFADAASHRMDDALAKAFGTEVPRNVSARTEEGNPKSVLTDLSRSADMLVVGRRGHSTMAGQVFGSVSSYCSAHASCPVLVVHVPDAARR